VTIGRGGLRRARGCPVAAGRDQQPGPWGRCPSGFLAGQPPLSGQEESPQTGYTPLFIRTELGRERLLEVGIAGTSPPLPATCHNQITGSPATWDLSNLSRDHTEAWRERANSIGVEVPSSASWVRALWRSPARWLVSTATLALALWLSERGYCA